MTLRSIHPISKLNRVSIRIIAAAHCHAITIGAHCTTASNGQPGCCRHRHPRRRYRGWLVVVRGRPANRLLPDARAVHVGSRAAHLPLCRWGALDALIQQARYYGQRFIRAEYWVEPTPQPRSPTQRIVQARKPGSKPYLSLKSPRLRQTPTLIGSGRSSSG